MIIVDPDDVVGSDQRLELLRHTGVHTHVAGIFLAIETRQVIPVMERGPQRGIGKAAIVLIVVAPRQANRRVGDVAALVDHRRPGLAHDLATPAEPHSARLLQRVEHAYRQTAGRGFAFLDRRDTIRYHDQSAHYTFTSSVCR